MGQRAVELVGKGLVPDGSAAAAGAGRVTGLNLLGNGMLDFFLFSSSFYLLVLGIR